MSRQQVAIVGVRVVALWLIAKGVVVAAASVIYLTRRPIGYDQPAAPLLIVTVIALVAGLLLWGSARWIARRVFRDAPSDEPVSEPDFYRIASAFAGLFLLSQSVPGVAASLSNWLLSYTVGRSVLGSAGLDAEDRELLFDVLAKSAIVGTVVQLVLGAYLLAAPGTIARAITRLREDRIHIEPDEDE